MTLHLTPIHVFYHRQTMLRNDAWKMFPHLLKSSHASRFRQQHPYILPVIHRNNCKKEFIPNVRLYFLYVGNSKKPSRNPAKSPETRQWRTRHGRWESTKMQTDVESGIQSQQKLIGNLKIGIPSDSGIVVFWFGKIPGIWYVGNLWRLRWVPDGSKDPKRYY